jgi:hypothetical protein
MIGDAIWLIWKVGFVGVPVTDITVPKYGCICRQPFPELISDSPTIVQHSPIPSKFKNNP